MIRQFLSRLIPVRKVRKELRFVPYRDADNLLQHGWTIAKEEDHNHVGGMVYLELLQDAPKGAT